MQSFFGHFPASEFFNTHACLRQPFADQFVFAEGCQTNTAHPPSAFAPINLVAAFFSCVGRESPNSSLRLERGEGQANKDRVL